MRLPASFRNRNVQFLALSCAVHLTVCAFLFVRWLHPTVTPVVQSQAKSETKYYPAMLLAQGGSRKPAWTPERPGRKRHVDIKQKTSDLAVNAPPAPPTGRPMSAQHDPVVGDGADMQNAAPAFPVFSPHPAVKDRSLLPESDRQVIVDVKVSAAGDVLEATLVQGLGNALDQIVLDTVRTWRFHPATVNGNPVNTEAELVFPFNDRYPMPPS